MYRRCWAFPCCACGQWVAARGQTQSAAGGARSRYACVYNTMPPFGLGRVGTAFEATGQHTTADGRLGRSDGTNAPIALDGGARNREGAR
jgi:hypothetical protein